MPDSNTAANTGEVTLSARSALAGYSTTLGEVTLRECEPTALVSIGFDPGERAWLASALKKNRQLDWPTIGHSIIGADSVRLLALQADQIWLSWPTEIPAADRTAREWLADAPARLTDQSDGWACLDLQGERCAAVLERLCAIDLSDAHCPVNAVVRTTIEHTGTILLRLDRQHFRFITPRSSVHSLLHAIESVATHVATESAWRSAL